MMRINCSDQKIVTNLTLQEVIQNIKKGCYEGEIIIFDSTLHDYNYYPYGNEIYKEQINKKKTELEELLEVLTQNNHKQIYISRIIVHPSLQRENNSVADDPQKRAPIELQPLFHQIQKAVIQRPSYTGELARHYLQYGKLISASIICLGVCVFTRKILAGNTSTGAAETASKAMRQNCKISHAVAPIDLPF